MVGAGAVVTHDVPARAIVSGNPARIVGYVDATAGGRARAAGPERRTVHAAVPTSVAGVTLHRLARRRGPARQPLRAESSGAHIPFAPRRYFMVFDVPGKDVRGEHAHRRCHQFLVCARGSVSVVVDDGTASEEIALDVPTSACTCRR